DALEHGELLRPASPGCQVSCDGKRKLPPIAGLLAEADGEDVEVAERVEAAVRIAGGHAGLLGLDLVGHDLAALAVGLVVIPDVLALDEAPRGCASGYPDRAVGVPVPVVALETTDRPQVTQTLEVL